MLDEEIIVEQKTSDPNVGRNPFDLFLKLGKYFIGAVAIETSILRFAVTDIDGTVIDSSFVEIDKTQGEDLLKICKQSLNKLCKKNKILKTKGNRIQHSRNCGCKKSNCKFCFQFGLD